MLSVQKFQSVGSDQSMWVKMEGRETIMLCTHVDDSFVTSNNENTLLSFHNRMLSMYGNRFDGITEMDAKEYVGMERGLLANWSRDLGALAIASVRLP
jgi:hypothetical protein